MAHVALVPAETLGERKRLADHGIALLGLGEGDAHAAAVIDTLAQFEQDLPEAAAEARASETTTAGTTNPYPGLAAFSEQTARFFFGRRYAVDLALDEAALTSLREFAANPPDVFRLETMIARCLSAKSGPSSARISFAQDEG